MKKWLILLVVLLFAGTAQADFVGIYGQFFIPEDTARLYVTVHDTLGLSSATWDSATILRYYRGVRIDSLDETSATTVRTGLYEIKFKADPETDYDDADSIGQYHVVLDVWKDGRNGQKAWNYYVVRGNGLHGLYNVQWFLGAADNGYRVLHPPSGIYPKDSVQYYRIVDEDGDGAIELGDTTQVSTVIFYHSNISRVLDSTKTLFHYTDL